MTIKVKYLSEDEIEKRAELLLSEYEYTTGEPESRSEDKSRYARSLSLQRWP